MDGHDGGAVVVLAGEHVLEFEFAQQALQVRGLGLQFGGERFVLRLLAQLDQGEEVGGLAVDLVPLRDPVLAQGDFLHHLLCGDVVVPEPVRVRARLEFRYFAFLVVYVKETPGDRRPVCGYPCPSRETARTCVLVLLDGLK